MVGQQCTPWRSLVGPEEPEEEPLTRLGHRSSPRQELLSTEEEPLTCLGHRCRGPWQELLSTEELQLEMRFAPERNLRKAQTAFRATTLARTVCWSRVRNRVAPLMVHYDVLRVKRHRPMLAYLCSVPLCGTTCASNRMALTQGDLCRTCAHKTHTRTREQNTDGWQMRAWLK